MQVPKPDPVADAAAEYAHELRRWRERRGMTKKALAEQMAYDRSYVSHIEGSNLQPTEDFTRRADQVLNTGGALWARWEAHAAARGVASPAPSIPDRDLRTTELVAWLADHSTRSFRETYDAVATLVNRLDSEPAAVRYARDHARSQITRAQLAQVLVAFYDGASLRAPAAGTFSRIRLDEDRAALLLSILVQEAWLDGAIPLAGASEVARYLPPDRGGPPQLDDVAFQAAVHRLASIETAGTIMVDNPLYRLLDVALRPGRVAATFTSTDFATYALTADLLESELLDALASAASGDGGDELVGPLPLRDIYLPTTDSALALAERDCVGGPVALLAIARGPRRGEPSDYLLLIQERSSAVLNVTGKLAVIPKAFHQPTGEPADEALLSTTLHRELEEELLGRQDLEQLSQGAYRQVDPLHAQHLSEPMAWLLERRGSGAYRVECTGFGLNMVTGNYEFACLMVVDDERWWDTFGHRVETNWETMRVRRYSSRDTAGLAALANDPRWSNEGLFAFLQGSRRLSDIDSSGRVAAPTITLEL